MGRDIVVVWSGSELAKEMKIRSGMRKKESRELEHMKRLFWILSFTAEKLINGGEDIITRLVMIREVSW